MHEALIEGVVPHNTIVTTYNRLQGEGEKLKENKANGKKEN